MRHSSRSAGNLSDWSRGRVSLVDLVLSTRSLLDEVGELHDLFEPSRVQREPMCSEGRSGRGVELVKQDPQHTSREQQLSRAATGEQVHELAALAALAQLV